MASLCVCLDRASRVFDSAKDVVVGTVAVGDKVDTKVFNMFVLRIHDIVNLEICFQTEQTSNTGK